MGYLTPLTPFPACPHSLQSEKKKNPTSLPPWQETIVDGLNAVLPLHQYCPKDQHLASQILQHYSHGTVCGRTEAPTWDDRTVNIPSETEPGQGNPTEVCFYPKRGTAGRGPLNHWPGWFVGVSFWTRPLMKTL